jgi:hypothetical protein
MRIVLHRFSERIACASLLAESAAELAAAATCAGRRVVNLAAEVVVARVERVRGVVVVGGVMCQGRARGSFDGVTVRASESLFAVQRTLCRTFIFSERLPRSRGN